ncbi:hypothetical protein ON010_g2394 [Phytophthora cinnamomi]|nr:hypothetical protein ON010_g2394 [Phytophthora cinnamomi]
MYRASNNPLPHWCSQPSRRRPSYCQTVDPIQYHTALADLCSSTAPSEIIFTRTHRFVTYTSLTLRIPTHTIKKAQENQTISIEQCGQDGCLLLNASLFGSAANNVEPFVNATPICEYSGSGYYPDTDKDPPYIVATKLRTTYSLTVGILNWTSKNLATVFGSECKCADESTNCSGVWISSDSLKQQSKVLLAGDSNDTPMFDVTNALNTAAISLDPCDYLVWEKLVQVDKSLPMLLPRNFARVDQAAKDYVSNTAGYRCTKQADTSLNNTIRNHLFAEESLQMSYTAPTPSKMASFGLVTATICRGTVTTTCCKSLFHPPTVICQS